MGLVTQDVTKASLHRVEAKLALLGGDGAAAPEHLQAAEALRGGAEYRVVQAVVFAWQDSTAQAAQVLRALRGSPLLARWQSVADWLGSVLHRTAATPALREWVAADPEDEHRWLILALHLHLSGDDTAAAAALADGRHKASPYLLEPPWSLAQSSDPQTSRENPR